MSDAQPSDPALRGDWLFPTEIRFGAGRIAELGDVCRRFGISRPLIVTDRGLAATPIGGSARDAARGRTWCPGSSPRCRKIPRGAMSRRELPPSSGIAPMESSRWAAAAASTAPRPSPSSAACGGPLWRFAWPDHEAAQAEPGRFPIIAIPTTAGTGAEVEPSAIITDSAAPAKRAILHPAMLPKVVIADPALTVACRRKLTAATGMDALSHNLEALCVRATTPWPMRSPPPESP